MSTRRLKNQQKILKETRALTRCIAREADDATLDGLDPTNAVVVAFIEVCFSEMTHREIADWFRAFANGLESDYEREYAAAMRRAMRNQTH